MRLDMHLHSNYSRDSINSFPKIFRAIKRKGLDGFAVTDHNNTAAWSRIPKTDLIVIKGIEVKTTEGEILCYFLTEPIPSINKPKKERDRHEIIDEARDRDAVVVLPHPFDSWKKPFAGIGEFTKLVDGVEVMNARVRTPGANQKAEEFAEKHSLAKTGGSDAHTPWEIGNAYTEAFVDSVDDFRKALERKQTIAQGRKSPLYTHVLAAPAKLGLFGRPEGYQKH